MAPNELKRPRLTGKAHDLQEYNHKSEIIIVKSLLEWCFENTKIHELKREGSDSKKDHLLHWACEEGHLLIVEHLLEEIGNQFDDINCVGSNDETPLHKATKNGHKEIVEYLVDKGANVNAVNDNDQMPIHLLTQIHKANFHNVSSQKLVEIANILVDKDANLNHKDSNDDSPLLLVLQNAINFPTKDIKQKGIEIAKVLIEKGVDVNATNYDDETPLHIVARDSLVEADTKRGKHWFQMEVAKLLIDKGANMNLKDNWNDNTRTPLHTAIFTGNAELAKLLISKGADLRIADAYGDTPLHYAIRNRDIEMAKLMDTKGARITNLGEQFLKAASDGNLELCELLKSIEDVYNVIDGIITLYGRVVNCQHVTNGNTPLHLATKNDHYEVVKFLMENNARWSLDVKNKEENRPLHYAKCKKVAELLLKHGAMTDCKNKKGQTPKDTSIENKAYDVTEIINKYEKERCNWCFKSKNGTFAFVPCGHAKMCESCLKNWLPPISSNPKCPTCWQPVTTYQKIFI